MAAQRLEPSRTDARAFPALTMRGLGGRWRDWRRARTLAKRPIPDALWNLTLRRCPFLGWRDASDLIRLRELSTLFLADKEFSGVNGLEVTDAMAVQIAAQACLPIVKLGLGCYRDLKGIVVHEGAVAAHREVVDEHGVVHQYTEELAGEAMEGGPVMLSWQDVGGFAPLGYNVVIHEFVHVVARCRGSASCRSERNGFLDTAHWELALHRQYLQFCALLNDGVDALLDRYAAENVHEFLAVASETFFVTPVELRFRLPELYELLVAYFEQDPAKTVDAASETGSVRAMRNRPR